MSEKPPKPAPPAGDDVLSPAELDALQRDMKEAAAIAERAFRKRSGAGARKRPTE